MSDTSKKEVYGRIVHKHDTPENWSKATNFTPKDGEFIIYDYDTCKRLKIGDGQTKVNNLPFTDKGVTITVTPSNIAAMIQAAPAGSTIQLTPGNYGLLKLHVTTNTSTPGKSTVYTKPFADNITIKGMEGAVVAGIDISGCYKVSNFTNQVNEGSQLSSNLTIEDLTLSNSLSIRTCSFDGISIKRCKLTGGGITVTPNSYANNYNAPVSGQENDKYLFQSTRGNNLSIRHCTIDNYDAFYNSALYVHTCDNIEIYQNTITNGGTNAITVRGKSATTDTSAPGTNGKIPTTSACKGKITIHNNDIYNASNYGVYVTELQDASVQVLRNNFYYGDGTGTYVRILNHENSYITTRRMGVNSSNGFHNLYRYKEDGAAKYTDVYLVPGSGVSISGAISYARKSELTELSNTVSSNNTSLTNSINSAKTSLTNSINSVKDKLDSHISYNISASPTDNLSDIIKNAKDGATITLADGNYSRINLFGNKSFRNNITIKGSKNAIIDGMSISSGIRMAQEVQDHRDSDVRKATMSSNLTIEGVTFTHSFCVKNCIINGVAVIDCKFEEGAGVYIVPNSPYDVLDKLSEPDEMFGYGDGSASFENVPLYNTRVARNILVKGCEFINSNLNTSSTAIYMKTIDGAYVTNNLVHAANFNGIQITGSVESYRTKGRSTGKIVITNNDIRNTGSRSIRLSFLENAYACIQFNTMSGANLNENNGNECIKISNLDTTNTILTKFGYTTSQGGIQETNHYVVRNENGEITSSQLVAMGNTAKTSYIYLDQSKSTIDNLTDSIQSLENSIIVVTVTEDDESGNYVCSHSPMELLELLSSGKGVVALISVDPYHDSIYQCVQCEVDTATFANIRFMDDDEVVNDLSNLEGYTAVPFLTMSTFKVNYDKSVDLFADTGMAETSFPTYERMNSIYNLLLSKINDLENKIDTLITSGTDDPDESIESNYYIKYDE